MPRALNSNCIPIKSEVDGGNPGAFSHQSLSVCCGILKQMGSCELTAMENDFTRGKMILFVISEVSSTMEDLSFPNT